MAVTDREILEALSLLADEEDLKVAVTESLKGGALAGVGAFVGGLLGGGPGMAAGGAIGGLCGWATSKNFRPVSEIIVNMPEDKRDCLVQKTRRILEQNNVVSLASLSALTGGGATLLRSTLVQELIGYLTQELSLKMA